MIRFDRHRTALRIAAGATLLFLAACAEKVPTPPAGLSLSAVNFESLPGWQSDRVSEALPALRSSCRAMESKPLERPMKPVEAGRIGDWLAPCAAIETVRPGDEAGLRAVLERAFTPYAVRGARAGLFTGYYEASLLGAWHREGAYQTPLWTPPDDMLTLNLGAFRDQLKGQKIVGKVQGQAFVPYDDRAAIAQGSLAGRAKPLLWVNDPVDAFFLEIQGSGCVHMQDGSRIRVGYAAQNGHGYVPVGRLLAEAGEIERPVTMAKIRAWFAAHPDRAQSVMNENPSVVFFKKQNRDGAVGAQGVELTPLRSLAVDPSFIALGMPLWLATDTQKRLVVAQDTGGAIKGAVRGDLFWGEGEEAAQGAGDMQDAGTYYLLLPKKVDP